MNFTLSDEHLNQFKKNGFLILKNFFSKNKLKNFISISKDLFEGIYSTGIAPDRDKWNKNKKSSIPRQLCNVWKSSKDFQKVILNKHIGEIAAKLMGWSGVKIGQDSLIWVPKKKGGVSMHQDNPYQDWHSSGSTITCWIALTDVDQNNSGLQFLKGSHVYGKDKTIKNFFNGKNFTHTIKDRKFKNFEKISIEGKAGTISFHHGNIWHGSNVNNSNNDRISISIHLIPASSKYSKNVNHSIYSRYKKFNSTEMDENYFPILWTKNGSRSNFL